MTEQEKIKQLNDMLADVDKRGIPEPLATALKIALESAWACQHGYVIVYAGNDSAN